MKKQITAAILIILVIQVLLRSYTYFRVSKEINTQSAVVFEKFTLVKVISEARIRKIEEIISYVTSNSDTIEKVEGLDEVMETLKSDLKEKDVQGVERHTTEMNKKLNEFLKEAEVEFEEDREFKELKYDFEEATGIMYDQLSNYNREAMIYNNLVEFHKFIAKINGYEYMQYCDVF